MIRKCQGRQSEDQLGELVLLVLEEQLILGQEQAPQESTLELLEALVTLEQMLKSFAVGYRPCFRCQECADQRLTGPTTNELNRALEFHYEH